MSILDELPHKCQIGRMTRGMDSVGGNTYGFEIEQSNVECWEQQASASEIHDYEKRGINITTKIFFVDNPNVTERHRIMITERFGETQSVGDIDDVTNPNVFDVKSSPYPDASAGLGVVFRVMCGRGTGSTQ